MKPGQHDPGESDLPAELAAPARRALTTGGYTQLEQLTEISEAELKKLHGMGPKATGQPHCALGAKGLSFAGGPRPRD